MNLTKFGFTKFSESLIGLESDFPQNTVHPYLARFVKKTFLDISNRYS